MNFHEQKYLRLYQDVAQAIEKGIFSSGKDHWCQAGRLENREVDWYSDWCEVYQQKLELPQRNFTFIIPCYNNLEFTQQTIESIQKQNDVKFIFIDNDSTDGTKEYLQTVHNSIIIHNEDNLYVTKAWNQGFREVLKTETDYVCLCNNDIVAGKNWLQPIQYLFETRQNEFYFPASNNRYDSAFEKLDEMDKYIDSQKKLKIQFQETYFTGFCFFFRWEYIQLFYPLPYTLKIIHGDDYIVDTLDSHGIVPAKVNQCVAYHHLMTTQKRIPELEQILQEDETAWKQILDGEYKRRGIVPKNRKNPNEVNIDKFSTDRCLLL